MPFDKVDPKVDFPAMERDILAFWVETRAFDKLREINRGKPRWSFLDGPITANNPMGVHHAWGRTYKDLYQRYFAASPWTDSEKEKNNDGKKCVGWGHELRYQNGFDCQGLWVEVGVEKEHGFGSKKDIEGYGIGKFVEECKARALKFAGIQTEQSKRLGQWMDWENSYYTMSDENNYSIWEFLKKCHEKGLIYKGVDVMPWCPRCGTGISQMEMNEGYREVAHTSVFVLFPLLSRPLPRGDKGGSPESTKEFLLVWTTTPWTLSSNVAAAVKPEMTYVKVKQGDRFYYLGKANFEAARSQPVQTTDKSKIPGLMPIQSLFKNNGPFEVVEELPGSKLLDRQYQGPFDSLPGAAEAVAVHRVIAWDAVTESEGTGIVHIAPGCGAEDYALGKELGLPRIAPLFEDGKFRPEFGILAGRRFDQVADDVVADLKTRGLLFAKEQYWHRYPHCWRCKDELVYRLVDEWFINMNWRDEIMDSVRQARWIPEWGLERELDWLRNMGDWMISKKRYWGLALPIWECHECGHFEILGSREELKARAADGWEKFEGHSPHRPWIDDVKIRCGQCGNKNVSRVKDVGNPWLDASIVSFSTMKYFTDREYWQQWFPADFVVEAFPGQFRNWFYALLTVSTMMVGRSPFKVLKGHGLVMDDEGKPMHKSSGNAIEFNEAANKIGVDVMRWLYASTPPERNVLFGPHHTDEVRREVILPLWNVYSFFCNLARVDDFKPDVHTLNSAGISLLDDWIQCELDNVVRVANEAYSNFDVERFCKEAKQFIDNLSTWYVRRSRRRFYAEGWPADKKAAFHTLYKVLEVLNRVIAPIVPFLSEAIYQNLVARQRTDVPQSVHHTPIPYRAPDPSGNPLRFEMSACIRLVSLGRSARKDAGLKIRQPIAELVVVPCNDWEKKAVETLEEHIHEELNVKKVSIGSSNDTWFTINIAPNMKLLGPKFGRHIADAKRAIENISGGPLEDMLRRGEPISLGVDGTDVRVTEKEVIVTRRFREGWAGAADGATVVLIDTRITPDLRNEGLARDIVRNVQNLRKDAGLDIADRIHLSLLTDSPMLRAAIDQFHDYIAAETLATEITGKAPASPLANINVEIDGKEHSVVISISKA